MEKLLLPGVSGSVGSCECAGEVHSLLGEMDSQSVRSLDVSTVMALTLCTRISSSHLPLLWTCRQAALWMLLAAESKPLQLQEIMCVPSWEHSISDKHGLWIWRTSGYMATCLQLICSVGDAAEQSSSARLPLSWRLFVLV